MRITDRREISTITFVLDEAEAADHRVMAPWGHLVLPVSLTVTWVYQPGPGWEGPKWGPATWVLYGLRSTGDPANLTNTDLDPAPAWITRAIDEYHPSNYEG